MAEKGCRTMVSIVLFAGFAFFLLCLALGAVWVFTSKDSSGRMRPMGCLAGCALALVLGLLGLVGFIAFVASLGAHTSAHALESLPIKSATILTKEERAKLPVEPFYDPRRPLHVILVVEGHEAPLGKLEDLIREMSDGEARSVVGRHWSDDGEPITIVDVALPADAGDLHEIEHELRYYLEDLRLENGVQVRLGGSHRDW
jgi:hypothetical protein